MKASSRRALTRGLRTAIASVAVGLIVGSGVALAGSAGVSSSAVADSSSAITVAARDQDVTIDTAPLPDLEVTVSQTKDLLAQGVAISWTGGKKSGAPTSQTGGSDFLQIMQCWGDDPENPGQPDRTTCQYGGFGTPGARRSSQTLDETTVAPEDAQWTSPKSGPFNPAYTSVPFRSSTGKTIAAVSDRVRDESVDPGNTEFFTKYTTNEVPWAGSATNGTGSVNFFLQTDIQAPGLGCGRPSTAADGAVTGQSCWLVVIPRGTADPGEQAIVKSGLDFEAWKHRLAVKLDFLPTGVHCPLGTTERQLAGSEFASDAMRSWQPALCGKQGGSTYTLIAQAESDAVTAANQDANAPLALTTRAVDGDRAADKLVYAPVAVSGLSIAFSIDRAPRAAGDVPADAVERSRLPLTDMKLTPRLVAKMLSFSYVDSLPDGADKSHIGYHSPADAGPNARNLTRDPEFLAINDPEWAYQSIVAASVGDALVPFGRSDGARAVWDYVMSDEKARAFLDGQPDEWGMKVNPWASTNASVNPTGTGIELPRDDFPRPDPIERAASDATNGSSTVNLVAYRPYTSSFDSAGVLTLQGDGQILGGWDPTATPPRYSKQPRRVPGDRAVVGITDTAAASKYTVYTAALLNPAGQYVAPTTESMTSATAAMTATAQTQVYSFDPSSERAKGAASAYPLTLPVYAASRVDSTQQDRRTAYADFIDYAATAGQVVGTAEGQLPAGYAPIPEGWRDAALVAAESIRSGKRAATAVGGGTTGATSISSSGSGYSGSTSSLAASSVDPSSVAGNPAATGEVAGVLTGKPTPDDPKNGAIAAAVPAAIGSGFACSLALPLMTRLRRRFL